MKSFVSCDLSDVTCIVVSMAFVSTALVRNSCLLLWLLNTLRADVSVSLPIGSCSTSDDCYPDELNSSSVPTKYINCSDQKCVCSDCFYATNSYKSCAYQRCWKYDNITQTCNDLRKDQRTALFLSLFLSALGAANFYIERYDLGGIQLAILVLLPFILLGITCIVLYPTLNLLESYHFYGLELCTNDEGIIFGPFLALCCLWVLLMAMWWVADVVTFAENLRVSGDGCPLR